MKDVYPVFLLQLLYLIFTLLGLLLDDIFLMPHWYKSNLSLINSGFIGSLGGVLYCLRGIYLNKSVKKQWDQTWHAWYFIRPICSFITGIISYVFLKAGLLVLDASQGDVSFGYLAIAFIAGYNVDNFLRKIEGIGSTLWGVERSNSSNDRNFGEKP